MAKWPLESLKGDEPCAFCIVRSQSKLMSPGKFSFRPVELSAERWCQVLLTWLPCWAVKLGWGVIESRGRCTGALGWEGGAGAGGGGAGAGGGGDADGGGGVGRS